MTREKRSYQMKRRAELQEATRLRIVESTVSLHGTLGPSRTTISAVAEHAGVRRATVYRHFPDESALFAACTSHWMAANRPPDYGQWASIADPARRLAAALAELYAYYRRTAQMMDNIFRDEDTMPIVKQMLGSYRAYMTQVADALTAGRAVRGNSGRRAKAVIGHAVAFTTWRSLTRDNHLGDAEAVTLMCQFVAVATDPRRSRPGT
jgi:AcrR family transcriptional regulator